MRFSGSIGHRGISLAALAAALALPAAAAAQSTDVPAPGQRPEAVQPGQADPAVEDRSEDIVVTGFRSSLAKALDQKRTEAASVDSILAEDIGKFPDLNLSESIQRIPGVALARDGGEGRQISVRGLGPQFTRVRINGLEALSTAGGSDASGGTNRGRGFDFNVFASDLFNSITVRKTSESSVEEGSLGATVDLRTARPFDYKGLTIAASAQGAYNDLNDKFSPRGAFMIANQTADGRFGALVSVAYSKRQILEEGFSTVRWARGSAFSPGFESVGSTRCVAIGANGASGAVVTPVPAACAEANAALHPRFPRYDRFKSELNRLGVTASIQWKPSDSTQISVDGLYADFRSTREEQYLEAPSFSVAGNCTAASRPTNCGIADTEVVRATIVDGIMRAGTFDDVDLRVENRFDRLRTEFKQVTVDLVQKLGEDVTFNVIGGLSRSAHTNPVQNTITFDQFNVDGYSYDFTDGRNPVFNFGTARLTDPTAWVASQFRLRSAATTNDYKSVVANLTWRINDEFDLLFGGQYKKYDFATSELRRTNGTTANQETTIPAAVAAIPLSQYGQVVNLGGTSVFIPNYFAGETLLDLRSPTAYNGAWRLGSEPALNNNKSVTEEDKSAYFQANFKHEFGGMTLRGNAGLRYVETSQTANGASFLGGAVLPATARRSYEDYLPSANIVFEPMRNLVLRLAAAEVMARPDLTSLPPGGTVSVSGATRTVSFGNPNLDPYRASTYDAAIEWYFQPGALLSVAVFQKDIRSFVQTVSQSGVTFTGNPYGLDDSIAIAACGNLFPATCNPASNNWTFSVPQNSPGGRLRGYEVNFQLPLRFLPSFLSNTGVLLNYTSVNSRIQYLGSTGAVVAVDNLTGLSPRSANATLYYEDKFITARVSGAYRDDYLTRVPGIEVGTLVEGTRSTFNLDASLQLSITDRVKVTFEAINLTDQYQNQYIDPGDLLSVYHHTGREFLVGVRFNL